MTAALRPMLVVAITRSPWSSAHRTTSCALASHREAFTLSRSRSTVEVRHDKRVQVANFNESKIAEALYEIKVYYKKIRIKWNSYDSLEVASLRKQLESNLKYLSILANGASIDKNEDRKIMDFLRIHYENLQKLSLPA